MSTGASALTATLKARSSRKPQSQSCHHDYVPNTKDIGVLSLCRAKPGYLTFGDPLPNKYFLYDEPRQRFNLIEAVIFDNLSLVDDNSWPVVAHKVFRLIEQNYVDPESLQDRIFFGTLSLDINEVLNKIKRRHQEEVKVNAT